MKNLLTVLIVLSLALNAALAFYVFRGDAAAAPAAAAATARVAATKAAPAAPKSDAPAPAADVLPSLATKELPALIAELRDAGFPPEVVRAIASALIGEQFTARLKALDPDGEKRPFWKDPSVSGKYQQAMAQAWQEQRKALRALLGAEADADPVMLARQRQQFGNLPPEKMSQAQDIVRNFDEKRQEVYSTGIYTGTEREKLVALEKQQRAALAQVLSPAEMEEYDLRSSNTGRSMRQDLVAFNPTEEEFRTIFKLRQPFDEQWNTIYQTGLPDQSTMERRNAASRELAEQIKAALGPVRGPDYEITTDYNYRRVSQVVARLELPPETTKQLWDTQKSFQQRAMELRRGGASPADRTAQLTALQEEATTQITGMLGGSRGFEAYKQYGGSWLTNFVPRPPPAPPAAPKK